MRKTISHEEIKQAFREIYNDFYLTHRTREELRTDKDWEKLISHAHRINEKYNSILVRNMVDALMEEIEEEEKRKRKDVK